MPQYPNLHAPHNLSSQPRYCRDEGYINLKIWMIAFQCENGIDKGIFDFWKASKNILGWDQMCDNSRRKKRSSSPSIPLNLSSLHVHICNQVSNKQPSRSSLVVPQNNLLTIWYTLYWCEYDWSRSVLWFPSDMTLAWLSRSIKMADDKAIKAAIKEGGKKVRPVARIFFAGVDLFR